MGPDLASDQGSSREARLCAGLLARALPGPGSGLRKSWESWRELHRHPLKPTSWNGCAVCIDAVSPLRLCARTGAARCPAYLRLACAPQVHRTEGRQSRYHSTQSTVRHLAVFPGAELTSPQNWGQVSWSGGVVCCPALARARVHSQGEKTEGSGWRLGLGRGGVGGKVFGGGVCIGAQVSRGCGCWQVRTVHDEVGFGAGKRGANLEGPSAGWELQALAGSCRLLQALPWWLQGSAWSAWSTSSSRAAPTTTNLPTTTKHPDDEVWRGTAGAGPARKTSFGRVAGCSVSWRSLEMDGGAWTRICTRWTRRLQSADGEDGAGRAGNQADSIAATARSGGPMSGFASPCPGGGISKTVVGEERRRQGAGGGRGRHGRVSNVHRDRGDTRLT